jgi:hypothetical protein
MKDNDATRFIRQHYRASAAHMKKHVYHLFMLYRGITEMQRQIGEPGFQQWLKVHCPEIPWEDVKMVIDHVKNTPASDELSRRIFNS